MNKREEIDMRKLFIGIDDEFSFYNQKDKKFINFDNAATTPPFYTAAKAIEQFLPYYGSVGRGSGYKSQVTTKIFKESKMEILNFFDIKNKENYDVIYVKNTTEGMNLLANKLLSNKNDIVITSRMEHHSNDLPWRFNGDIKYIEVDEDGRLKVDEIQELVNKYKDRVKIITITGASNVTGYVNDIEKISKIAHENGSVFVVDGAQLVPHKKVNLEGVIDFLVFSAHKIYSPFGIGVIVYKKDLFNRDNPFLKGGGTVYYVGDEEVIWTDYPEREEAGTPNVLGVIALVASLKQIKEIGFEYMENHEKILCEALITGLKSINNIEVYSDNNFNNKVAIGTFNLKGVDYDIVSDLLNSISGIAVRSGCFCAHPYVKRLLKISDFYENLFLSDTSVKKPGMVRASVGLYNTLEEVNVLLNTLEFISYNKRI